MVVQENVALAPLTTLQIGGPARYFVEAKSADDVLEAVTFAHSHGLSSFVLGGGSNLVVADSGWPGLVLKIAIPGIERRPGMHGGKILFDAGAGESW
ncbi:MAG: FAD-binding protein, partial [Candidatus Sulfotelmatobacter sp.]